MQAMTMRMRMRMESIIVMGMRLCYVLKLLCVGELWMGREWRCDVWVSE